MKSTYLQELFRSMALPNEIWAFDLLAPSNLDADEIVASWYVDLKEALNTHRDAVIVGHSFGSIFFHSCPGAETLLSGSISLGGCPGNGWIKTAEDSGRTLDLADYERAEKTYAANPSDTNFADFLASCAPYYFHADRVEEQKVALKKYDYDHQPWDAACRYGLEKFDLAWEQAPFPGLCLSGEYDRITPIELCERSPLYQGRKDAQFVRMKGAGHFPWIEKPAEFRGYITRFLANLVR